MGWPGGNLSYDANDRLTSDMYDANGNTISSGGTSFAYNFQNQLVQSGGLTATYDGDGNRPDAFTDTGRSALSESDRVNETVGRTTTQYLIDTLNPTGLPQVMDELQNGAVTRTYAYGLERISEDQLINSTWTPSFYGYDGHGNVRLLTSMAGTVTDTYEYDAFGNLIESTGTTPNEFLFVGEQFDPALGFYYMRARYYRPATGRFWRTDPIEGKLCCGMSWNPYIYRLDNPVNTADPSGRGALYERVMLQASLIGYQVYYGPVLYGTIRLGEALCTPLVYASLVLKADELASVFAHRLDLGVPHSASETLDRAKDWCTEYFPGIVPPLP